MAHSLLEKKLNNTFQNLDLNINVINLALAGYEAKTISPLLRAFGHKLEPDLILGYLGANDINMLTSNNMASLRSFCNYLTIL